MKRQFAIAGAIGVIVLLAGYVLLLKPVGGKIKAAKAETATAQAEEATLRTQLKILKEAARNAPQISAQLAKFDLLLPRTSDLPTFIRQVQEAADESGVELNSIAPSPPSAIAGGPGADPALVGKGVFALNVVLNVDGGFFRIKSFLGRLEGLQRVVQVNNIAVTPSETEEGVSTLQSTITMQMFVVNPATQLPGAGIASPSPSPAATGQGGQSGPATPAPTSS